MEERVKYCSLSNPGWRDISSAPNKKVVMTMISDIHGMRNQQELKRDGNLWWTPDGSMYVYYQPTHWRETE